MIKVENTVVTVYHEEESTSVGSLLALTSKNKLSVTWTY